MPRILKDLKITEVSSVDRGAGRGVKVLIMKRDDTANTGEIEMTKEELEAAIAKAAAEAAKTATATVTTAFQSELAKRDLEITVLKMSAAHKAFYDGCGDEATKKAFADMDEKARDEHMKANPVKKRDEAVTVADLAKTDVTLSKALAENADMKKRLDAIDLEKSQESFKKRAAALGLTAEGDGELMRKAFSGDTEAQTAFEKRQAEVTAALKKQAETGALFSEFGGNQSATGDAYAALVAKGDEYRKTHPELSREQAFTKVYEDPANRDLVTAYKREDISKRQQAALTV